MLSALILGESTSLLVLIILSLFFFSFIASLISILWFLLLRTINKSELNVDKAEELKLKSMKLESEIDRLKKQTLWILGISLFCGLSIATGFLLGLLFAAIGLFIGICFLLAWCLKAIIWRKYAKTLNDFDSTMLTTKQSSLFQRSFTQRLFKFSLQAILPLGMLTGIILWFHYLLTS
jgi:hypothetical protein